MAQYGYNPLTGKFDRVGSSGGGGNVTLSGNSGSPLVGISFDIIGQLAGNVPVTSVDTSSGDLAIANNAWETQYVVDPSNVVGLQGTFTTIQAAINQAVADGATLGNYKVIKIRSKTYTENLIIPGGIIISGDNISQISGGVTVPYQGSCIVGNHTFTGNAVVAFNNVNFLATSGDIFSGGAIVLCYSFNCNFLQSGADHIFNITAGNSYISLFNCQLVGSQTIIFLDSSAMSISNCNFVSNGGINVNGVNLNLFNCKDIGFIECTGTTLNINDCSFFTSGVNYNISGTASGIIQTCQFKGAALAGIENTIACQVSNCSANNLSLFSQPGTVYNQSINQQGSIIQGNPVSISNVVNYTVRLDDHYVDVNNLGAGTGQIILPGIVQPAQEGQEFIIQDTQGTAATNNIEIIGDSGQTINGVTSYSITTNYGAVSLRYDGSNYFIFAKN
jgi:hypothetical protein